MRRLPPMPASKLLIQEKVRERLGSAELRAVFRQVARDWREMLERLKGRGVAVLVSLLVTSGLGALWLGTRQWPPPAPRAGHPCSRPQRLSPRLRRSGPPGATSGTSRRSTDRAKP